MKISLWRNYSWLVRYGLLIAHMSGLASLALPNFMFSTPCILIPSSMVYDDLISSSISHDQDVINIYKNNKELLVDILEE